MYINTYTYTEANDVRMYVVTFLYILNKFSIARFSFYLPTYVHHTINDKYQASEVSRFIGFHPNAGKKFLQFFLHLETQCSTERSPGKLLRSIKNL